MSLPEKIIPVERHPAKFSPEVMEKIFDLIDHYGWPERILDPFAGIGRIHQVRASWTVGVEIEPEWAAVERNTVCANTMHLPFPDAIFDGMVTSPVYGNRFSDHHNAQDGSERRSYTHDLRVATGDAERTLHPDNTGTLPWGPRYREAHDRLWTEVLRTLKPVSDDCPQGSLVIVNASNFYKKVKGDSVEQHVAEWHHNWFMDHGCAVLDIDAVQTKRMKKGANRDLRSFCEFVFAFRYVAPVLTPDNSEEDRHDGNEVKDPQRQLAPNRSELVDHLDTGEGHLRT